MLSWCTHLFNKEEKQGPTYPCLVDANLEGIDQVFQEHADKPEVDPTNTPGAVNQDHNVSNGFRVTHKLINWMKRRKENIRDSKGQSLCW